MQRRRGNFPLLKNVEISSVGSEGKALGRVNDMVVFVPFVVPGDIVDVQVTKKKKSYMEGKAVNFHKHSDLRITASCDYFGICGGCKWQNLEYDQQLAYKHQQVVDNLQRIAKVDLPEISPILPSSKTFYYRNKMEYTFSNMKWLTQYDPQEDREKRNMNGVGLHIPGMFDRIVDIDHCYLQADPSNQIRNSIREYAISNNLSFYNVKKWEGLLRNLIIRNTNINELLVNVIFSSNEEEKIRGLMNHIKENFPEITSLMYTVNEKKNDDISDQEVILFDGKPYMLAEMPSAFDENMVLQFKIQAKSFYQTNSDQAYLLYKVAVDFADLQGFEHVYDLYTGTGTIANFVAGGAKSVIGLEYVEQAVEDAKENSKINVIKNTKFYAGVIEKIMDDAFIAKNGKPDIIITDPPRAGMHPKVIEQILKTEAKKIVYISCNPATQARDIALLDEKYSVEKVQPVDMFPQTHHVENVVLLQRRVHID